MLKALKRYLNFLKLIISYFDDTSKLIESNKIPIIFVHGFYDIMTTIPFIGLWRHIDNIRFVRISYWGSDHDRACQLYRSIKGGRVDYGEDHSNKHKHKRYGDYEIGIYPEWDDEHPIHIMGFSQGGSTIRELYLMIQEGIIENQTLKSIDSLITIFGCNNGTSLSTCLGYDCDRKRFSSFLMNTLLWITINIHNIIWIILNRINRTLKSKILDSVLYYLNPKFSYYDWKDVLFRFNNILHLNDTVVSSVSIDHSLDRSLRFKYVDHIKYVHIIAHITEKRETETHTHRSINKLNFIIRLLSNRLGQHSVNRERILLPYEKKYGTSSETKKLLYETHHSMRWYKNDGLINRISQGIYGIYREELNNRIHKIDLKQIGGINKAQYGSIYIHHIDQYSHLDLSIINQPSVVEKLLVTFQNLIEFIN